MSAEETEDLLMPGGLSIVQGRNGYRYSIDTVLLAHFVRIGHGSRVVDLGTGAGILPLLLARSEQVQSACGIEIQQTLADRARRNVERNNLGQRIRIIEGDIRAIQELLPSRSAEVVVANPPYRSARSGRVAPHHERAAARHELFGDLSDFVAAAAWLLVHGGRLAMVYPAERLCHLFVTMAAAGIEAKRLRMVHSRREEPAGVVLVEGVRGARPGLQVERPLFVYRHKSAERCFTEEVAHMYRNPPGDDDAG